MAKTLGMALALMLACGMAIVAQDTAKKEHVVLTAEDVKWVDGPPNIPAGAKVAVLDGDPKAADVFTMRLKIPAGYKLAPHWHPGVERVTVLSGAFHVGFGEKWDVAKLKKLPAGGFFSLPPKTPHFAMASEETIVQLNSIGPWSLSYVNPADDPSSKK